MSRNNKLRPVLRGKHRPLIAVRRLPRQFQGYRGRLAVLLDLPPPPNVSTLVIVGWPKAVGPVSATRQRPVLAPGLARPDGPTAQQDPDRHALVPDPPT